MKSDIKLPSNVKLVACGVFKITYKNTLERTTKSLNIKE